MTWRQSAGPALVPSPRFVEAEAPATLTVRPRKASNPGSESKCSLRPDTTCSTRPTSSPSSGSASGLRCTTNARSTGRARRVSSAGVTRVSLVIALDVEGREPVRPRHEDRVRFRLESGKEAGCHGCPGRAGMALAWRRMAIST